MRESTNAGSGAAPHRTREEHHPAHAMDAPHAAAATAVGVLAGAFAGTAAGLGTMAAGPIGAIFGAIVGAEIIELGSREDVTEPAYTDEHDAHYRALWAGDATRPANEPFEAARPAYRFGHLAAFAPPFAGRDFRAAEAELRASWEAMWEGDAGSAALAWERARRYVGDGYGHSRGENFGLRRDRSIIGPAGSAVDPVELERARAGLPSADDGHTAGIAYDHAGYVEVNNINALLASAGAGGGGGLGEWPETDAETAHRDDIAYH